jgi:PAS domain S-box-containing protein
MSSNQRGDLEDFFENAAIGLHIVSAEGIILRANKAELQMLGYEADEYIGEPISAFHADKEVIEDILRRLEQGEKLDHYPARLRAKDGSIRHVRITSSGVFRDSKFVQTRCFTTDVTETVRAEQRFQQVLDALPAAVYTTDAQGRITYYNQAAIDLAGRRPQVGVDEWCVTWRLYTKDGAPLPHDQCPMAIALKEKRPVRGVEAWAERPDGTRFPFIPYPTPLYDETGCMTGAINMLIDISDRKKAEETHQLLINELNHRVKNTLAVVQALAHQTMRRTPSANEFVSSFSGRLDALARAHTVLSQSTWRGAEFSKLLRDELLLGTESDPRIACSGPLLLLTPQQALNVALIFHELATNARKYGALATPGGKLAVDWAIESNGGRSLRLQWAEQCSSNILNPASPGFGTTFIQQIVSSEGGSAKMTCGASGIAWNIKCVLRPDSSIADEIPHGRYRGEASLPRKVLVIEDEALIAMELEEAVRIAGAEAEVANRIEDALSKIHDGRFDAAILDVNLGGKRSDELAAVLRAAKIPFAISTGYSGEDLPLAFRNVPLLSKPFTGAEVQELLGQMLKQSRVVPLRPMQ